MIWRRKGNHGNKWNKAYFTFSGGSSDGRIAFEGVMGFYSFFSFRGDIAVDDIDLKEGICTTPGILIYPPCLVLSLRGTGTLRFVHSHFKVL